MADKFEIKASEGQIVRWLCYVGFFFCTISLVTSLSAGGPWIGFLLGTAAFGIPAVKMYSQHEDAVRQQATQARYRQATGQSAQDWDMGDPTVPPRGDR